MFDVMYLISDLQSMQYKYVPLIGLPLNLISCAVTEFWQSSFILKVFIETVPYKVLFKDKDLSLNLVVRLDVALGWPRAVKLCSVPHTESLSPKDL